MEEMKIWETYTVNTRPGLAKLVWICTIVSAELTPRIVTSQGPPGEINSGASAPVYMTLLTLQKGDRALRFHCKFDNSSRHRTKWLQEMKSPNARLQSLIRQER